MATDLSAYLDTINHRRPARILYHFGCTPDLHERLKAHVGGEGDYGRHYGCLRSKGLGPRKPADWQPLDFSRYWAGQELPPGSWINGIGVAEVPSGFYHFTGYVSPLRHATSLREIEEFPIEDYSRWDYSHYAADIAQAHAEGRPVHAWVGHMYEIAWQIRGYEEFLLDLMERPAWAECLLERIIRQAAMRAAAARVPAWTPSTAATTSPTRTR
jgi:hypothetical protein